MPKNKPHSGASKRFRVTGTGKIRRQKTGLRHNLEKKSSKVTRRMSGTAEVAKADVKQGEHLHVCTFAEIGFCISLCNQAVYLGC